MQILARPTFVILFCALSAAVGTAHSEADPPLLPPSPDAILPALRQLTLDAPVILSGEVLAAPETTGPASHGGRISVVRIRVDRGLRGVQTGAVFSLAQWRMADAPPFFPHQRVILFLHQPNAAGITSVIYGNRGILTIGGGNLVSLRSLDVLSQTLLVNPGSGGDCRDRKVVPRSDLHTGRPPSCLPIAFPPVLSTPPRSRIIALDGPSDAGNRFSLPAQQLLDLIAGIVRQQEPARPGIVAEAAYAQ